MATQGRLGPSIGRLAPDLAVGQARERSIELVAGQRRGVISDAVDAADQDVELGGRIGV